MVMPGDNVQMVVELIAPIAMEDGLRFAIREGGRTVGAGVVAKNRVIDDCCKSQTCCGFISCFQQSKCREIIREPLWLQTRIFGFA